MSKSNVHLKESVIKDIFIDLRLLYKTTTDICKALDLDFLTIKKIVNLQPVSKKTFDKFFDGLKTLRHFKHIVQEDLILNFENTRLPIYFDYYKSIQFGYFISQNREHKNGISCWFEEAVDFREPFQNNNLFGIYGSIQSGNINFDIVADLISDHLFVVNAVDSISGKTFSSIFSTHFDQLLFGVWVGVDYIGERTSVFSTIFSPKKLDSTMIKYYQRICRIRPYLNSNFFDTTIIQKMPDGIN